MQSHFMRQSSALWIAIGILILLPLSVDQSWSIPVGVYDIRVNYIGTLLFFLTLGGVFLKEPALVKSSVHQYLKRPFLIAFLLFGISGIIATIFHSVHLERSVLFLIWSLGTMIAVPFIVQSYQEGFGKYFFRVLCAYVVIQSCVVIADFLIATVLKYPWSLAKVYRVDGETSRPHAWYQEPNFFATFAMLNLVWLRVLISEVKDQSFKTVYRISMIIIGLGVICSTSKMGLLGILLFLFNELFIFTFRKMKWIKKRPHALVWIYLFGILIALMSLNLISIRYQYQLDQLVRKTSFYDRYRTASASIDVFKQHPVVGVGPGSAQAYLIDKLPNHEHLVRESYVNRPELLKRLRSDPLSKDLFSEVLAEWGVLGLISLLLGLFLLFRNHKPENQIQILALLCVVYLTSQTLPRYDLWVAVSLIASLKTRKD